MNDPDFLSVEFWNDKYEIKSGEDIVSFLRPFLKKSISLSLPLKDVEVKSKDLFCSLGFPISNVVLISNSEVELAIEETVKFFQTKLSHYHTLPFVLENSDIEPHHSVSHILRGQFWHPLLRTDMRKSAWVDLEGHFRIFLDCKNNSKIEEVYHKAVMDMESSSWRTLDIKFFRCAETEHASKIGAGSHFHEYECPARFIPFNLTYILVYLITQVVLGNSSQVDLGKKVLELYLKGNCPLGVRESTLFLVVK